MSSKGQLNAEIEKINNILTNFVCEECEECSFENGADFCATVEDYKEDIVNYQNIIERLRD